MCVVGLRGAVVGDDVEGETRDDAMRKTRFRGRSVPFLLSEQVELSGVGFEGRFRGGWVKARCI
jgi:hypothetical protein